MNTINITTSQNIELEFELASVGDRIVGAIIDWLIIIAYIIILLVVINFMNTRTSGFQVLLFLLFLPVVFYDLLSETLLNGQSLGKRVRGIKVMSLSGQQASFSQYLIRWVFRLIDFTFTSNLLGLILIAATEEHQRLGDIIAGTVLVKTTSRTSSDDTWYHSTDTASHSVTYPEVINLKDRDIQLIKEILITVRRTGDTMISLETQRKIEQILNIKSREDDSRKFLQIVIADYNHLTSQLQ